VFNGEIYNYQDLRQQLQTKGTRFQDTIRHRGNRPSLRRVRRGMR
jgi:asparagine synthetase B (glutamine-hydrolysing)